MPAKIRSMRIGERIRELRTALGLTQTQLAKRLGMDQGQLSRYETGQIKNPALGTLIRFAAVFAKTVDEFVRGTDMPAREELPEGIREFLETELGKSLEAGQVYGRAIDAEILDKLQSDLPESARLSVVESYAVQLVSDYKRHSIPPASESEEGAV